MSKVRGFEIVRDDARKNVKTQPDLVFDEVIELDGKKVYGTEIILPTRADKRSAGYDFYLPQDVVLLPQRRTIIWTDVKAYMQEDEVLKLYIRSSMGIKHGLMIANGTGIIDSSYYGNPDNDGNIGIAIVNTSPKGIELKKGERIAQGVFLKYLIADNDVSLKAERTGGFGSSGK